MAEPSNLPEYLNVLVTLCAAIIAYRAYISTTNDNRSKHIHDLFKEYLKSRMTNDKDQEEFIGFKLYTLEEIYNWIKKIKRTAKRNRFLISRKSYNDSMTFHAAWRETIKAHLAFEPSETLSAITAYEACYTRSFVDFAREALAPAIPKDQIPSPSGSDKEARERIAAT